MRKALYMVALALAARLTAQDIALRPFEAEGFAALQRGDYESCARTLSLATSRHSEEPSPAFVAARCYGRLGDTNRARTYLRIAIERGYRNCQSLAREEVLTAFVDLRQRCEANADAFVRESNPELLASYLADRAERSREIVDVEAAKRRDAARREVVRISLAHHELRTANDYLHAALIMQHGSMSDDFALARDLAKRAVTLRPWLAEARWLYAAATDRYLQSLGKPQIFGTQYRQVDGVWTLEPFDPTAVSDQERAEWRVHSLRERQRFIDELNRSSEN